ncbi:MAG: hypothetical protein ACLGI6_16715, partial [Gammaproteobacteria bacterium]
KARTHCALAQSGTTPLTECAMDSGLRQNDGAKCAGVCERYIRRWFCNALLRQDEGLQAKGDVGDATLPH